MVCGKPHNVATSDLSLRNQDDLWRIEGGVKAEMDEFPYMAMLTHTTGYLFCGAALISNYYVLTAAHCVYNGESVKLPSNVVVRLGDYNWDTEEESNHVNIPAMKITIHPKFHYDNTFHDLALVRMASPAPQTTLITPVCLPPPDKTFAGQTAVLSGWGSTDIDGFPTKYLQKAKLTVLGQEECSDRLKGFRIYLIPEKVCAFAQKTASCKGDSGGPLVWEDDSTSPETPKRQLVGIVSLSLRCASQNLPGLYTRVSSYLDWIRNNTADDNSICWG